MCRSYYIDIYYNCFYSNKLHIILFGVVICGEFIYRLPTDHVITKHDVMFDQKIIYESYPDDVAQIIYKKSQEIQIFRGTT